MAFALIMLAEYGNLMLLSMLGVILFLGGWHSPLPNLGEALPLFNWTTGLLWAPFWLLFKSLLVVSLTMWIRWTYPRLRADQLMRLCWKWLTPIGLGLLFVSALWRLAELGALHF
jgi:NADH-quinone oxidoreductase subunit H